MCSERQMQYWELSDKLQGFETLMATPQRQIKPSGPVSNETGRLQCMPCMLLVLTTGHSRHCDCHCRTTALSSGAHEPENKHHSAPPRRPD